jgi:hypothetical protein
MRKFFYSGDAHVEHGGCWYALDTWKWNYVDCVVVTPCSDAGGPSNCWWIETLTVNIPEDAAKVHDAMHSCGWLPQNLDKLSPAEMRHAIFDACKNYGLYDKVSGHMVRIGGPDQFYKGREGEFNPDKVLRGNSSLDRYVRSVVRKLKE